MSEFHVVVVEIGKIGKHPNADSLSITQVMNAYPCIFRTGDYNTGDKAVYVPIDALVPLEDERWSFLLEAHRSKKQAKIKAKKLRGIFSMGILTKADPSWEVGTNVQELLNIEKYEPPIEMVMGGESEANPGFIHTYTDIEGLRKYKHILEPNEEVVLTEKIHGANARFVWQDGRLYCGSHHQIKKETESSMWWRAAKEYDLATKLQEVPGMIFYGEVYGAVQDLQYGVTHVKPLKLAFFDIWDPATGRYMDFHDFKNILIKLDLEMVPLLYIGPWSEDLMSMSNGKTSIYPHQHCREGFVVRPVLERWNRETCRTIYKLPGEDYLLRKQKD
jgi:RNA ligase (TIGR02306 family)